MICFIRSGGTGFVKIGYSACPEKRLRQLQTGNPEVLWIEALVDGDMELETSIHAQLQDRVKRGEWFEICQEDLEQVIRSVRRKDEYEDE